MCDEKAVQVTRVRPLRSDVFGNSVPKIPVCNDCIDEFNGAIKASMNGILKNYRASYDLTSLLFLKGFYLDDDFLHEIWEEASPYYQKEIDCVVGVTAFEIRECPICKSTEITEHHIRKRSVFGPNNFVVYLCRKCHTRLETFVAKGEAWALTNRIDEYRLGIEQTINSLADRKLSIISVESTSLDVGGES
jgi:transposase-like protein